jgi:hypothetical protein
MAVFERLVVITERMEAKVVIYQEKLKGSREAPRACLEKLEACLERKERTQA